MHQRVLTRQVFFNPGYAEPQGSASSCQGSVKTDLKCLGWNSQPQKFYAFVAIRHLDHCLGLLEKRQHLPKVALQKKRWKTLE